MKGYSTRWLSNAGSNSTPLPLMLALLILITGCSKNSVADQSINNTATQSNLEQNETVLLFPTNARFDNTKNSWQLDIHGWVFEPEKDSIWRNGLITSFAKLIGVKKNSHEEQLFENRVRMFLVDNKPDKHIVLNAHQQHIVAPTTGENGHFNTTINLAAGPAACNGWLPIQVETPVEDKRDIKGSLQCVTSQGTSVISDIDDTIKISNVLDKQQLMKNTFTKEFTAVPGMADTYQVWKKQGVMFHYVSSSPWQLYPALSSFMQSSSFPQGSMHLKLVRFKDESLFNLFATPEEGKIPTITKLLKDYPQRKFILVGDSGEKDPAIYAQIARQYPDRIIKIYIRDIRHDSSALAKIFSGLPDNKWQAFIDANEIKLSLNRQIKNPQLLAHDNSDNVKR